VTDAELLISDNDRDSEAVMAVAANSLKCGHAHFGLDCHEIVQPAQTLHSRFAILCVEIFSRIHGAKAATSAEPDKNRESFQNCILPSVATGV
jgi:hypothetical protein